MFSTLKKLYVKLKNFVKSFIARIWCKKEENGRQNGFNDSQEKYYTRSDFLLLLQLEV